MFDSCRNRRRSGFHCGDLAGIKPATRVCCAFLDYAWMTATKEMLTILLLTQHTPQDECLWFLICCVLLWLGIDFTHIIQDCFAGTGIII